MDDIILRISRHYLTGAAGIVGLGAATYLLRRYLSNTEKTTNSYYTRTDEISIVPNISAFSPNARKIYIYWNGDFNSTYLLLDYLQQDYIVQTLYIERYTIRKALEHDQLQKYTAEYNKSKLSPDTNTKCPSSILDYLADVAKMKRQQSVEISTMTTLRRVIINQYPEFRANLLPTRYITVIEKDLEHSQQFYDSLRTLNLQPLEYIGIELFEQASRYIKNLSTQSQHLELDNNQSIKIVMGYSQDSHLAKIIEIIIQKMAQTKKENTNNQKHSKNKIELPLAGIPSSTIKYLATEKINKEVIRFLHSTH
jgi:hypothetical protein